MSDSEDVPKKGPPPDTTADEASAVETEDASDAPSKRSRSQSRRDRRKRQTNKQKQKQQQQQQMPPVQESEAETVDDNDDDGGDEAPQAQAGAMQPFQHIGGDDTSMDGPVTYARAQRGEIPMRGGNPNQALKTGNSDYPDPQKFQPQPPQQQRGGGQGDLMQQDGLKLRLDLNLDIEIELKAKIYGDLTLALL